MTEHNTWRSDLAIRQALQTSSDGVLAVDEPSDDGEDYEEEQTGSDSEEDASAEFRQSDEPESYLESEAEVAPTEEDIPVAKRRKTIKEDDESLACDQSRGAIVGKDGYKWYSTPPVKPHRSTRAIVRSPAPINDAKIVGTPLEAWSLLLNQSILEKIKRHTNEEIHHHRESIETETILDSTYGDVEIQELSAFVGLMYFSGLQKTAKTNLEDLWSNEYGSTLYRAAMPLKRFKFLSRMLRFDDKTTRLERREFDKLAPIREIWNEFVLNCTENYNPGTFCTLNEQILSFRGKCPFKVYNRFKPDKYGIKMIMLNDAKTYYMLSAEPYTGKSIDEDREIMPMHYVEKLSQCICGTNRNVTCDDWFTSVDVFDEILEKHSLTMIGKLRKNKTQIPNNFRIPGTIGSSKCAYDDTKTLLSYTPKRKKVVLLLSTMQCDSEVDHDNGITEIINCYNSTKDSGKLFANMCCEYTTARKTLRWPMRLWMGMLDQCGINSMIIYNLNSMNVILNRRDFLKQLIMSLVEPHLRARLNFPRLRCDLRLSIQGILKIDVDTEISKSANIAKGRARCAFCPRSQDRKVRVFCDACCRAVCQNHKTTSCSNCFARS